LPARCAFYRWLNIRPEKPDCSTRPGDGDERRSRTRIDPERREQLKRDFIAFHEQYRSDLGIAMPRDYLVTIGYRR
jgi:hypothetical protein